MPPTTRLKLCIGLLVLSAILLAVTTDPDVSSPVRNRIPSWLQRYARAAPHQLSSDHSTIASSVPIVLKDGSSLQWTILHSRTYGDPGQKRVQFLTFIEGIDSTNRDWWHLAVTEKFEADGISFSCRFEQDMRLTNTTSASIDIKKSDVWVVDCAFPAQVQQWIEADPSLPVRLLVKADSTTLPGSVLQSVELRSIEQQISSQLAICLAPIWGSIDERQLVEWREHHRMVGIETVHWYARNASLSDFVEKYMRATGVRDTFVLAPPISNSTYEQPEMLRQRGRYGDQIMYYADCHSRSLARNSSRWLAYTDLDEFIIPKDLGKDGVSQSLTATPEHIASLCMHRQVVYPGKHPVEADEKAGTANTSAAVAPAIASLEWSWFRTDAPLKCAHRTSKLKLAHVHGSISLQSGHVTQSFGPEQATDFPFQIVHLGRGRNPLHSSNTTTLPYEPALYTDWVVKLRQSRDRICHTIGCEDRFMATLLPVAVEWPSVWQPQHLNDPPAPPPPDTREAELQALAAQEKLGHDGKRQRVRARRTVDPYGGMERWRIFRATKSSRWDQMYMRQNPSYLIDLLPPAAYDNFSTSFCTKYAHTSTNKIRTPVNVVKWTPDAKRVLTGSTSGEFTLWNGLTFNFETILQAHDTAVRAMEWSPSGFWLISADSKGKIKYFQTNMNNLQAFQGHNESVRDLTWAPNDERFASAGDDGLIKIWDFVLMKEQTTLTGHGWDVKCVKWHPTKGLLVSGSKDNLVKFWDPRSAQVLTTLHGHKNTVQACAWSPNGNLVATASRDQLVKVFDIRAMKELVTLRGHKKEVCSVAWHPIHDDVLVSGGSEGSIVHWVVPDPTPKDELEFAHDGNVWSLAFHPLGHILCSASNDNTTRFWARNRPGQAIAKDRYHVGRDKAAEAGVKDDDDDDDDQDDFSSQQQFVPGLGRAGGAGGHRGGRGGGFQSQGNRQQYRQQNTSVADVAIPGFGSSHQPGRQQPGPHMSQVPYSQQAEQRDSFARRAPLPPQMDALRNGGLPGPGWQTPPYGAGAPPQAQQMMPAPYPGGSGNQYGQQQQPSFGPNGNQFTGRGNGASQGSYY